jgi:hypothetical protein
MRFMPMAASQLANAVRSAAFFVVFSVVAFGIAAVNYREGLHELKLVAFGTLIICVVFSAFAFFDLVRAIGWLNNRANLDWYREKLEAEIESLAKRWPE